MYSTHTRRCCLSSGYDSSPPFYCLFGFVKDRLLLQLPFVAHRYYCIFSFSGAIPLRARISLPRAFSDRFVVLFILRFILVLHARLRAAAWTTGDRHVTPPPARCYWTLAGRCGALLDAHIGVRHIGIVLVDALLVDGVAGKKPRVACARCGRPARTLRHFTTPLHRASLPAHLHRHPATAFPTSPDPSALPPYSPPTTIFVLTFGMTTCFCIGMA